MKKITPAERYRMNQISIRRLALDGQGNLNRDAKAIAIALKRFCRGGRSALMYSPQTGMIDPVATAAAAAKQEVWEYLRRLLNIDDYTDVNLREDE